MQQQIQPFYTPYMNRTPFIETLKNLAEQNGYDFYTGTADEMPAVVKSFPAMWLETPEFHSIEGCNHGRITYNVKLTVLRQGHKLSPEERASAIAFMEQSLLDIVESLSDTPLVASVEGLRISARSPHISPHGAIGACATALIETIF